MKRIQSMALLLLVLALSGCACAPEQETAPPESPTGYPGEEVQAEQVFCQGKLYVNAGDGTVKDLPEGCALLGTVAAEDGTKEPAEAFAAAHVPVGTELYGDGGMKLYLRYAGSSDYRIFRWAVSG